MKYYVDQPYLFDSLNEKDKKIQEWIVHKARIIISDDESLKQLILDLNEEVKRLNDKYTEFVELGLFIDNCDEEDDIHICVYHQYNKDRDPIISLDIHRARGEFSFTRKGGLK